IRVSRHALPGIADVNAFYYYLCLQRHTDKCVQIGRFEDIAAKTEKGNSASSG
ncbi:MAG: hypothetical protein ACD_28C00402G0002, partial [uncultured bacterium]